MSAQIMNGVSEHPRRFVGPLICAIVVHGLLLASPAWELWSSKMIPKDRPAVQVELIEAPSVEASPPEEPRVAKALPEPPKTVPPKPMVSSPPVLPQAPPVAPTEPVSSVVEIPYQVVAPVTPSRLSAFAPILEPTPESLPEPERAVLPPSLSASSSLAPIARPLPSAKDTRVFQDSVSESGPVRTKARLGDNPRPEYPRTAREAGWEGTVVLKVEVLENGTAGTVTVNKTSGHEALDQAALSAVQKWKFAPAMDGAFPVRSVVYLPVQFDLRSTH